MPAAPASASPSTPRRGRRRLGATTPFFAAAQAALAQVARAWWAWGGFAFGLAWVAGWFFLALPFAYDVPMRPASERLLEGIALLRVPLCILLAWGSGALVAHGRRCAMRIHGAAVGLPGQVVAANIVALACIVVAVLAVASLAAAALQWADGRAAPDWALYAAGVVNVGWGLCLWAGVAVAMQALAALRWRGTAAVALALLASLALPRLGAEHMLLYFGPRPMPYSQLNGYGQHLAAFVAAGAHYSALTALVVIGAWALGPGTPGESRRQRFARAKRRLRCSAAAAAPCAVLWLGSGAWICHTAANSAPMASPWAPQRTAATHQASMAAEVGRGEGGQAPLARPTLLALDLRVELHPRERRVAAAGTMLLGNVGATRINEFSLFVPPQVHVNALDVPARLVEQDVRRGVRRYTFDPPLRPIERIKVAFDMAWRETGFANRDRAAGLAANSALLAGETLVPRLGPAATSAPPPSTAPSAPGKPRFKVRVGTSMDQIAIAPGSRGRVWKEDDRRYFEYAADSPNARHFTIHSGRYVVARDMWRGVVVEVFHAPAHATNAPLILRAVKASLERCAAALGPPLFAAFRVVEAPFTQAPPVVAGIAAYAEPFAFAAELSNRARATPVFAAIERDVARQWGAAAASCRG